MAWYLYVFVIWQRIAIIEILHRGYRLTSNKNTTFYLRIEIKTTSVPKIAAFHRLIVQNIEGPFFFKKNKKIKISVRLRGTVPVQIRS